MVRHRTDAKGQSHVHQAHRYSADYSRRRGAAGRSLPGHAGEGKGTRRAQVRRQTRGARFAKEIKAKPGLPVWRMDEETERGYSLKLTAVGLKAIVGDEQAGNEQSTTTRDGDWVANCPCNRRGEGYSRHDCNRRGAAERVESRNYHRQFHPTPLLLAAEQNSPGSSIC